MRRRGRASRKPSDLGSNDHSGSSNASERRMAMIGATAGNGRTREEHEGTGTGSGGGEPSPRGGAATRGRLIRPYSGTENREVTGLICERSPAME